MKSQHRAQVHNSNPIIVENIYQTKVGGKKKDYDYDMSK